MYKESIVLFVDILGFSELVKKRSGDEIFGILNYFGMPFQSILLDQIAHNTPEKFTLDEIPNVSIGNDEIDSLVNALDKANGKRKSTIFSDNVLVSYELEEFKNERKKIILITEIERIIDILKLLIQRDILFRGGLVIGDIYHGEKTVFGPALINAYKIESNLSNFPRICVENNIVHQLKTFDGGFNFNTFITEDFDGMYFIDYLKFEFTRWLRYNVKNKPDSFNNDDLDAFLIDHKTYIVGNLEDATDTKYYTKIAWQKNYHNNTLKKYGTKLKNYDMDINKYLIKNN